MNDAKLKVSNEGHFSCLAVVTMLTMIIMAIPSVIMMSMSMPGTIHMAVSILAILSIFTIHMSMSMTVSVPISILPIFCSILSILWRYKFLKRAHRVLLLNLF